MTKTTMSKQSEIKKFIKVLKLCLKQKELEDMPTTYTLQILNQIKQILPKQTDSRVLTYLGSDPKVSYLWSRLNFLEQQAMLLIYHEEFVRTLNTDLCKNDFQDISTNNILFSIFDSLAISVRRTMEALIELKGFASYDNKDLYKIYFCCSDIETLNRAQEDRNVFFNAHSKNIELQIKILEEDLATMLKNVSLTELFFLRSIQEPKFLSMSENIRRNHSLLTPEELLMLGYSYKYFSYLSDSAHLRNGNQRDLIAADDVLHMYSHLGFILLHAVTILAKLCPEIQNKKLDQINNLVKNNDLAKQLFTRYSGDNIHIGDYVTIAQKIARVIKINHSSCGYKSYKVKFIDPPLIPEHMEENFIPTEVRFFYRGEKLKKDVINLLGKEYAKGKANKELILSSMDKGIIKIRDILREIKQKE